ncbi:MAG: hypothetical protein AAF433_14940 [Bacteroidota bacterium]
MAPTLKHPVSLFITALLLAGWGLWWANFGSRGLFLDEANLALAVRERSFIQLWQPLPYEQYAPPLYLVLVKALAELFSYDENYLRLPSLLGACLGIYGLWLASKRLELASWRWLPVALFFVAPICLRYSGEFKPYMLDLGLTGLVLAWALSRPRPRWYWAPIGALLIWLSMPMVFSLAAAGLYVLWQQPKSRKSWSIIAAGWGLSFLLFYWLLLAGESSRSNLQSFHAEFFFPLRFWTIEAWQQAAQLLQAQLKHAFGFVVLAQVWAAVGIFMAGWQARSSAQRTAQIFLLLGPWLLAVLASSIGKYSLIPRLMLFSYPGWWLLACLGWYRHFRQSTTLLRWFGPAGVLILLLGTNVYRHYQHPLQVGQVREALQVLPEDHAVYVNKWAVPAVRYYRELHEPPLGPAVEYYLDSLQQGPYQAQNLRPICLLYSMETIEEVHEQRRKDSLSLSSLGYQLSAETFFRSRFLVAEPKSINSREPD